MKEKDFEKLYEEFLENRSPAPRETINTGSALGDAIENYICAIQEHTFRDAFQMGYKKGMEAEKSRLKSLLEY